jgi:hypothetical protein
MAKKVPIPIIYINSTAFSGSTLLTRLLLSHPNVASVGELTGYVAKTEEARERYCSCGQKMLDCPFWQDLAFQVKRKISDFNPHWFGTKFRLLPYRYRILNTLLTGYLGCNVIEKLRFKILNELPAYRNRIENIIYTNQLFVESICRITGASIFVDASKYATYAKFLTLSQKLDLRVVHLTRDSRGVVNSYRKNSKYSIIYGAMKYNLSQMKAESLRRWMEPDKHIRIRYEDLCVSPLTTVNQIFNFVGLPELSRLDLNSFESIHILGNRMRHVRNLQVKSDTSYREQLSLANVLLIDCLTFPYKKRFGYLRNDRFYQRLDSE